MLNGNKLQDIPPGPYLEGEAGMRAPWHWRQYRLRPERNVSTVQMLSCSILGT